MLLENKRKYNLRLDIRHLKSLYLSTFKKKFGSYTSTFKKFWPLFEHFEKFGFHLCTFVKVKPLYKHFERFDPYAANP